MDYTIDAVTWRKDSILSVGQGFGMRPGGIAPTAIVIHTTNNTQATSFDLEAKYLRESKNVSAHYLIGKAGQIAQLLHPDLMAWHAGAALSAWTNEHSIGIEAHVSVGEYWTATQHDALTWLVKRLMGQYRISAKMIETHRKIAVPGPNIRKHDPEGWRDAEFYAWVGSLMSRTYKVRGLPIFQAPSLVGATAGYLIAGDEVEIDVIYPSGAGHLASGLGFVDMDGLELAL